MGHSQNKLVDYIKIISENKKLTKETGINKLSESEKKRLNELFNSVFILGIEASKKEQSKTSVPSKGIKKEKSNLVKKARLSFAYKSKVVSDDGDILKLVNGAVVEITYGFLGYVGYGKKAVLYKDSHQWKIWVEGKKLYRCDLLKQPNFGRSYSVEQLTVTEVKGNGAILVMDNGEMYEVSDIYSYSTSLWGFNEVLLLDGYELINLDTGDEIIEVTKIR